MVLRLLAIILFWIDALLWVVAGAELLVGIFIPIGHILFLLLAGATGVLALFFLLLLLAALII